MKGLRGSIGYNIGCWLGSCRDAAVELCCKPLTATKPTQPRGDSSEKVASMRLMPWLVLMGTGTRVYHAGLHEGKEGVAQWGGWRRT